MKNPKGGFSYSVSKEQIREWMNIPAQQKLEWLEEANEFLDKALTPEKKKIREKFRRGEMG